MFAINFGFIIASGVETQLFICEIIYYSSQFHLFAKRNVRKDSFWKLLGHFSKIILIILIEICQKFDTDKMFIRKCRRSNKFICPACGIIFGSQDSLSQHAYDRIDAYDDSSCLDSLFKCEFCNELWPNKKSLSHHMTFNKRCKRIQNLHDDMSKLHPKCIVASSSAKSSEVPSFSM